MFDDIRPYNDNEVQHAISEILKSDEVFSVLNSILPDNEVRYIFKEIYLVRSIKEFQQKIILPIVSFIVNNTTDSLTYSGINHISSEGGHLFISNHRDIVMDAAFLSYILMKNGLDTVEIGIGNNLLIYPWIEHLVRLNKSFIVKRNLRGRQLFAASRYMSEYIRHAVVKKRANVWISQREGRAKDGDDKTQLSVLKMLTFSKKNKYSIDYINELCITPVSISYEYDPCDVLKSLQLYHNNRKKSDEDLLHMKTGILGYKGRVHIHISEPIELPKNDFEVNNLDLLKSIAKKIDKEIYRNYSIFPVHYISWNRYYEQNKFSDRYSSIDEEKLDGILQQKLTLVDLPYNQKENLFKLIYMQYKNILENFFMASR